MSHPNKRQAHEKAHELNEKRKKCNQEILRRLTDYLNNNPGMRFNQALWNLDILTFEHHNNGKDVIPENTYYTEPEDILKRMR